MKRDELENKLDSAYEYANQHLKSHAGKMLDKHSDRLMQERLAKYYEENANQISRLITTLTNDNIEEINKELEELLKPRIDQTKLKPFD